MSIVNGLSFVRVDELVWGKARNEEKHLINYTDGHVILPSGKRRFTLDIDWIPWLREFHVAVEIMGESYFKFRCYGPVYNDDLNLEIGRAAAVRYLNGLVIDRHTGGSYGEGRKEVGVELRAVH